MRSKCVFVTDLETEGVVDALNNLVNVRNEKVARVFLCHAPRYLLESICDALEIEYSKSAPGVEMVMAIMDSENRD